MSHTDVALRTQLTAISAVLMEKAKLALAAGSRATAAMLLERAVKYGRLATSAW